MTRTLMTRSGKSLAARQLGAGDAAALRRFHENLSAASRSTFTPHSYDPETIADYIRRSEAGDDRVYVLLSGEDIVGYFFLWEFRERIPALGIGLADAFQGEGLGAQLMNVLIDDAREAGREGIELTTLPDNNRAFQLYQRMGFEYIGDVENVAGDGRVVIERRMFLALKDGAKPSDREFRPPA